jgi:hypothetical protein
VTKRTLPAFCYLRRRSGGRAYVYFERAGQSVRMTAEPGSPEFALEYAKLLNGVQPIPTTRDFAGLVKSYHQSKRYRDLAPRTARDYDKVTAWVVQKLGPLPVAKMQRKDVIRAQAVNQDTVRFANYIVQVLRVLMEHAIDIGWRDAGTNPAKGVALPWHRGLATR